MSTLKRTCWWLFVAHRKSYSSTRKKALSSTLPGRRVFDNYTKVARNIAVLQHARNLSTSKWSQVKAKPSIETYEAQETPEELLLHSNLSRSVPYLEAYNLMEENADIIFDQEKMMNERGFNVKNAVNLDSSKPCPASELPGPKSWPLVGCLPYMLRHKDFDPQRVYLFWRSVREEFGPIFRKDMPGHPNMVFITDPADLQTLYQSTMYNPVRPGMQSLKKIRGPGGADGRTNTYYEIFNGKAGILAEQEEEWWRVRRRVQKPITNHEVVGSYLPEMNQVAKAFIDRIRAIRNEKDEVPDTFVEDMYEWALESLGTIALERRLGCLDATHAKGDMSTNPKYLVNLVVQLLGAFHETENIKLWQYFPTTSIKKLQEAHDVFTGVGLEAIKDAQKIWNSRINSKNPNQPDEEGRQTSQSMKSYSSQISTSSMCPFSGFNSGSTNQEDTRKQSLLEMLLAMPGLSQGDVLTFLLDMLATGIDTTSHTAGNMLYLLARHPDQQQRLREEILRFIPDPKNMTTEQLGSLTYAKAVFRETLRVMPVNVAITRKLIHDTVLSGYLVPKGWQVVMPTMLMNFQERIFPRALDFLPERFLRGSDLAPKHHFGFLPFSFGPRMCVGRRIAYQEIICLIIRILTEFEVDYKHEDIELVNRLAYGPSRPLKLTFKERR